MRSSVDTHKLSKKAGSLSYKVQTYILRIYSSGGADNGLNAFLPHCCKQHILRRYTVPVERRHTFGIRFKRFIHNWKAHTMFIGNLIVTLMTSASSPKADMYYKIYCKMPLHAHSLCALFVPLWMVHLDSAGWCELYQNRISLLLLYCEFLIKSVNFKKRFFFTD